MSFRLDIEDISSSGNNNRNNNNINSKFLFTGDTIFIDGIGRPDLQDKAEKFTNNLYKTYRRTILKLPDYTLILPAHFNASSTTLKHGMPVCDTLGVVKKKIKLLSVSKDEFVKSVMDTIPPRPANYSTITGINKSMTPCDDIETGDLEAGPNSCSISA